MITFPSFKNLFDTFASKFKEKRPDIDPTIDGNWSFSFGQGVSSVGYSLVILVKQLIKQFFPQTATGPFLALWGSYDNIFQLDPAGAIGSIAVTGVDTTVIPANESWQGTNGVFYENSTSAIITAQALVVSALTSGSGIATCTTTSAHNLATGMSVVMSGANEVEYNGTVIITIISATQFTYVVTGSPSSPATGSPAGAATFASLSIQSTVGGIDTNLSSGSILTYQGSVVGVDATATADFSGLQGGTDQEDIEAFRARILLSRSSQEGVFTETQIELAAKLINGNTRVYVQTPDTDDITDPDPILPGQVRVYIIRDNDVPITPTTVILNQTKQSIIDNGKLPAPTWEQDVEVLAPVLLDVDFDFTAISPDTGTMRQAVEDQLTAYFTDEALFATDIDVDVLRGVVYQTQDLVTGVFITSFDFTLTPTPVSGSVPVDTDELPQLGAVTWP